MPYRKIDSLQTRSIFFHFPPFLAGICRYTSWRFFWITEQIPAEILGKHKFLFTFLLPAETIKKLAYSRFAFFLFTTFCSPPTFYFPLTFFEGFFKNHCTVQVPYLQFSLQAAIWVTNSQIASVFSCVSFQRCGISPSAVK